MRVALAMMVRKDREPYLERVRSIMEPLFEGTILIEDESIQLTDYASQRNRLIGMAEEQGFDWILMLDADECMFPEDVETLRRFMEVETFIFLPTIEMAKDFEHFDPTIYPDAHGRAFKLHEGYHYRGALHEVVYRGDSDVPALQQGLAALSPTTPIYHYGRTKGQLDIMLRYHNYNLVSQGLEPVTELPSDAVMVENPTWWASIRPFPARHPLRDL